MFIYLHLYKDTFLNMMQVKIENFSRNKLLIFFLTIIRFKSYLDIKKKKTHNNIKNFLYTFIRHYNQSLLI